MALKEHSGEKTTLFLANFQRSTLKMWLSWQQGRSIFHILVSKHHLHIFRKIHKVPRKNLFSFPSYAPNATGGGGGGGTPIPNPERVKIFGASFRAYSAIVMTIWRQSLGGKGWWMGREQQ